MTSIWMATAHISPRPTLSEDMTADVCVVGAGIASLTTAYLLADEGRSVIVLDDGAMAGAETSRTTAHLVNALDDRYSRSKGCMERKAPGSPLKVILQQ
jgi:glycine/D-amino acid oxidase-like deaminating enzyme